MSGIFLWIAGAMFGIPLVVLLAIALVGDIPSMVLTVGGWSMALGVVLSGIGSVITLAGG